jgi:DNA-binding FadR family transcriptional regulator
MIGPMVVTRRSGRTSPASALERLRTWLARAHLVDGRVPPERELAAELGLARSALRQALAALEAEGKLDRHVGRGTFLVGSPRASGTTSPGETMQVRAMLEPSIIPLVIEAATRRDFERLEECLREGEAAPTFETFERWDGALHRRIVAALKSRDSARAQAALRAHLGRVRANLFGDTSG